MDEDEDSKDSESAGIQLSDTPVKKLRVAGVDSSFTCAKCSFSCDEREKFLQHIVLHRSDANTQQCQECGLCFSVYPSLKRHLFMVHKIRNFTKYKESTGLGLKPEDIEESPIKKRRDSGLFNSSPSVEKMNGKASPFSSSVEGEEEERKERKRARRDEEGDVDSLEALTCNVCYRNFDESGKLKKHMRTHGMAFIKSKRNKVPQWFDD